MPTSRSTTTAAWRDLERAVARYFEAQGYTTRLNHRAQGRSGSTHEIDVLAERTDAAGPHRVAVECKAWKSPIDKDVVFRLQQVMADARLTKGVVVSTGGALPGAWVAAREANIELWGPDEIRRYLDASALGGVPLAGARVLGVLPSIAIEQAERTMVLRHRRSDGAAFWGCSTFPKCRRTAPADA